MASDHSYSFGSSGDPRENFQRDVSLGPGTSGTTELEIPLLTSTCCFHPCVHVRFSSSRTFFFTIQVPFSPLFWCFNSSNRFIFQWCFENFRSTLGRTEEFDGNQNLEHKRFVINNAINRHKKSHNINYTCTIGRMTEIDVIKCSHQMSSPNAHPVFWQDVWLLFCDIFPEFWNTHCASICIIFRGFLID